MSPFSLHLGDCLDILPRLAPGSVDACITDPPYGFHSAEDAGRRRNWGVYSGKKPHPKWREFVCDWNDVLPVTWLLPLRECLVPGAAVVIFTDNLRPHRVQEAAEKLGYKFLRLLYWVKTNPPSNPSKNFMNAVETAVFLRVPGKVRAWSGEGCTRNVFTHQKEPWQWKVHPTQKPIAVMQWLVELVTSPGMTVLDPFMGSGTTGVAALRSGCRFVGIERRRDYMESAEARITGSLSSRSQLLS